jgi:hypothetical protein
VGSLMMGGLARRGAMNVVRRMMGAVGSRAASPTIADRVTGRDRDRQASTQRVSTVRIFRQAPALGAAGEGSEARRSPAHAFGANPLQRAITGGSEAGRRAGIGAQSDARVQGSGRVAGRNAADGARPASLQVVSDKKKDRLAVRASGGIAVVSGKQATSGSVPVAGGASGDIVRGKHVRERRLDRPPVAPYETRSRVHSASLRDGPPRIRRDARRLPATPASRRYRDYTAATKEGARVVVPSHR